MFRGAHPERHPGGEGTQRPARAGARAPSRRERNRCNSSILKRSSPTFPESRATLDIARCGASSRFSFVDLGAAPCQRLDSANRLPSRLYGEPFYIGMPMRWYWSTLVCLVALDACTPPGPRERGRGEAAWGGTPPIRLSGPCVYEVQTRWATALPHIVRLTDDTSEWSIVLSGSSRFGEGRTDLSPTGEGGSQGLVLEGATVRGTVLGALDVSRHSDSTFIEFVGVKAYRDTVRLEAACRLGPIPPAGGR